MSEYSLDDLVLVLCNMRSASRSEYQNVLSTTWTALKQRTKSRTCTRFEIGNQIPPPPLKKVNDYVYLSTKQPHDRRNSV